MQTQTMVQVRLSNTALRLVGTLLVAGASTVAAQVPVQNGCGVSVPSGPPCPPGFVAPPLGWFSGDSHEHIQHCFSTVDATPADLYASMHAENLDTVNALIWAAGFITPDAFLNYTAQFVTGDEDPITAGDPSKCLQFGVETSGVSVANLGHMIGLGITNAEADIFQFQLGCTPIYPAPGWRNDGSGDFSQPILDLFKQAPEAVTGYAHQSWPVEVFADVFNGGWDWEDPLLPLYVGADSKCAAGQDMAFPVPKTCGNTQPVLAPFDVALGRIDFIEAFEMLSSTCDGPLEKRYFGLYYRLLNAGQFVALSAGTDADCIGLACDPRVWVKLEQGADFTYDNWTRALKLGRTSISHGPHQFLELTVNAKDPGDTILLTSRGGTPQVHVKATYMVDLQDATQITDFIEIVQDGTVVASQAFGPMGTGTHTYEVDIPVSESGWIAARTGSYQTHTGAVLTRVDGKPTTSCVDADYWAIYADFLNWNLDLAKFVSQEALEFYVGCSEMQIRDYINRGRKIFAAVRDYDVTPPLGVQRFGTATPSSCAPPPGIVTDVVPTVGQPFKVRYFNAPPGAIGALVVGLASVPAGIPVLGANLHVVLTPAIDPFPTISNDGGYGELNVAAMPSPAGIPIHMQWAWLNPEGCNGIAYLSASDALTVTCQP